MKGIMLLALVLVPAAVAVANRCQVIAPVPILIPVPVVQVWGAAPRYNRLERTIEYDRVGCRSGATIVRKRVVTVNHAARRTTYGPWEIHEVHAAPRHVVTTTRTVHVHGCGVAFSSGTCCATRLAPVAAASGLRKANLCGTGSSSCSAGRSVTVTRSGQGAVPVRRPAR